MEKAMIPGQTPHLPWSSNMDPFTEIPETDASSYVMEEGHRLGGWDVGVSRHYR